MLQPHGLSFLYTCQRYFSLHMVPFLTSCLLSNIYLPSKLQLKYHLFVEICLFLIPLYFFIPAIWSWSVSFSYNICKYFSHHLTHFVHLYRYTLIFFFCTDSPFSSGSLSLLFLYPQHLVKCLAYRINFLNV